MRTLAVALVLSLCSAARGLTIAAFGDSLTTSPSYLQLLPADRQIDLGVAGETTDDGVLRLAAWLQSGERADLVIVLEGTNDLFRSSYSEAATVANLEAMVVAILQAGGSPILVTPPPVLTTGRDLEAQRAASLSVALVAMGARLGVPTADVWSALAQHPNLAGLYFADGVHPNAAGDQVIAQTLLALPLPEPGAFVTLAGVGMLALFRRRSRDAQRARYRGAHSKLDASRMSFELSRKPRRATSLRLTANATRPASSRIAMSVSASRLGSSLTRMRGSLASACDSPVSETNTRCAPAQLAASGALRISKRRPSTT
jgi:hypothetical protein